MKVKRFHVAAVALGMATVCIGAFKAYDANRLTTKGTSVLLSENSIALSQDEYFPDCIRETNTCSINVGVRGSIKLLGGTIIKAGADGIVRLDGQVTCSSGGKTYCKPVECSDLYSSILN